MSDAPIMPPVQNVPQEIQRRLNDAMAMPDSIYAPLAGLGGDPPPAPAWFANVIAQTPQSRFVIVEGAAIHYLTWGDARKPGLLLTHGNAAHARWWSFIAPFLAADYHVAAMDLSGMGDSAWRAPVKNADGSETSGYSMALFAKEQMAVCADAGMFDAPLPPIIVGHSFGGFVTMLTGGVYGEKLGGVVIVDSPINPPVRDGVAPPVRQAIKAHHLYPSLAAALARFRLMPPQTVENLFLLDWVARHSLREREGGFSWKFDPAIWRQFSIGDTSALLKGTRCRIAMFRGEHSVLMPPGVVAYIGELVGRGAPVVEIPEAKHHIMLDQPLALVTALRTLLSDWDHVPAKPGQNPGNPRR
jgi:pimeloyl-ACP methyl ester carboxylesterase